jgi:predicted nucleotidyltransferase
MDMDREQVMAALRAHEAELHRFGVAHLYLFGSVAREQARADSDVDLFFDTDNPRFSLIELVDIQEQVSRILGTESDVMTRASLHPMLRPRIESEALLVF